MESPPPENRRTIRKKRSRLVRDGGTSPPAAPPSRPTQKRKARTSELPGALPGPEDDEEMQAMDTDIEPYSDEDEEMKTVRHRKREISDVESAIGETSSRLPRPSKKGRPLSPEDKKRMPSVLDRPTHLRKVVEELKPGEEWINEAGDQFRVDADGRTRRLVEVKEQRKPLTTVCFLFSTRLSFSFADLVYRHVVGPMKTKDKGRRLDFIILFLIVSVGSFYFCSISQVVVEKWLTKEEFEDAQKAKLLTGQPETPEEREREQEPDSISSSRENSVFYEQGPGTPLGSHSRSTSVARAKSPIQSQQGGRLRIASGQNAKPFRNLVGLPRLATTLERRDIEHFKKRQDDRSAANTPSSTPPATATQSFFGAPSTSGPGKSEVTAAPSAPVFGTSQAIPATIPSFGVAPKTEATEPTKPAFSFGAPPTIQPAASTPTLSFGQPAPSGATSITTSGPAKSPFSFGAPTSQPSGTAGTNAPFSFGAPTSKPSGTNSFGQPAASGIANFAAPPKAQTPATSFAGFGTSFGAGTAPQPPQTPSTGFSYAAPNAPQPAPSAAAASTPTFSFGASQQGSVPSTPKSQPPAFSFGVPSQPSGAAPAFQFGAGAPAQPSQNAGPTFNIGSGSGTTGTTNRPSKSFVCDLRKTSFCGTRLMREIIETARPLRRGGR
jgi:hypothetical protein